MALTTQTVTGVIYYSDGTPMDGAIVSFTLNGTASSATDPGTVPPNLTTVTCNASGEFTTSLWPNSLGAGATNYSATVTYTDATSGKGMQKILGKFTVPSEGSSYTLSELLAAGVVAPTAVYFGVITQAQYDEITTLASDLGDISDAVAATEANTTQTAIDRAVVAQAVTDAETARDLAETYAGVDHRAATWADLALIAGLAGDVGYVGPEDTGTHTDPIAAGTVANEGVYTWAADGLGSAQAERTASTGLAGFGTQIDANTAAIAATDFSLLGVSDTYGVAGDLADGANASFGTYGFPTPIPRDGVGVRYTFRPRAAGTIYVQIQSVSGDIKTVEHERLITVAGAGPEQTVDLLDLPYTAGQTLGVRASPSGALGALTGTDPVGWWFTTAAISEGGSYTDATLSTNAIINHRFELLEQVATGPRVKALEDGQYGIVGADGDAASFHVHFVLGESHAAGVPTTLSPEVVPTGRGYCYRRATTSLGPLQDPTGNTATAIAGTGRGSPWVAFGSQLLRQSANLQGAIVVNSGYGGTTAVGQWASGGIAWLQAVTDYGNAVTAIETDEHIISGHSISIILGSNDAAVGTTKANFKAAMIDLIARARTLVGAGDDVPVTLMKTGLYVDGSYATAVAYVQDAQEEIAAEETNVYLGYSAEYAVSKGEMIDNVHMTQGFYDLCGASIAIPSFTHGSGK